MAAKKTQKKKRYVKKKESGFKKYNHEIIGILVLALGILILLSFYFENSVGVFGLLAKETLLGIFGIPAFLIPPLIVLYAIFMIFKKDDINFNLRSIYTIALVVLVSAMIQTGFYRASDYEGLHIFRCISKFYNDAIALKGGGVLGGLVSLPLLKAFQVAGTIVILTAFSIVDIILLTNISVVNFIRNINSVFVRTVKSTSEKLKNDYKNDVGVVGEDEDFSIEFNSEKKVIDFEIEKTSREIKQKTEVADGNLDSFFQDVEYKTDNRKTEVVPDDGPIEFFMNDVKRKQERDEQPEVEPIKHKEVHKEETKYEDTEIKISAEGDNPKPYKFPPFSLLSQAEGNSRSARSLKSLAMEGARKLEFTLKSFGIDAKVINVSRGPAITRYELQPAPGVKVSKIVNLTDDIALNLAASGVRIEAPIPGKAAIGIEVPNKEVAPITLREVLETKKFKEHPSKLAVALGKDVSGEDVVADIGRMPHVLIAGATGSGKSVCINSLIMSILYKSSPEDVKLLMIDPKVVELGVYNGIPHLLIPVVTEPKKAAGALNWAVQEMVERYKKFADKGVRDIKGYNAMLEETNEEGFLPQVVIIIDELADLMMVAPHDVEDAICRLAQMARAAGMHLVIATQRPSVNVITGVIKANVPSRIAFSVSSQVDSRTILDMGGAEKLLGKGDMLFYPVGEPKPIRVKGAFVSDKEVEKVVEYIKNQVDARYDDDIIEEINSENVKEESDPGDNDELLPQAIELVVGAGQASVSMIQRKFRIGYARAGRIVDQMEERGIVGPHEGSKPRQVMISKQQWNEMQMGIDTLRQDNEVAEGD